MINSGQGWYTLNSTIVLLFTSSFTSLKVWRRINLLVLQSFPELLKCLLIMGCMIVTNHQTNPLIHCTFLGVGVRVLLPTDRGNCCCYYVHLVLLLYAVFVMCSLMCQAPLI